MYYLCSYHILTKIGTVTSNVTTQEEQKKAGGFVEVHLYNLLFWSELNKSSFWHVESIPL